MDYGHYGSGLRMGTSYSSVATAMSYPLYITGSGTFPDFDYNHNIESEDKHEPPKFSIKNLSDCRKKIMRKELNRTIKQYKFREGVDNMTTGLKWLMFFIGVGILFNFGTILDIISKSVGAN